MATNDNCLKYLWKEGGDKKRRGRGRGEGRCLLSVSDKGLWSTHLWSERQLNFLCFSVEGTAAPFWRNVWWLLTKWMCKTWSIEVIYLYSWLPDYLQPWTCQWDNTWHVLTCKTGKFTHILFQQLFEWLLHSTPCLDSGYRSMDKSNTTPCLKG